MGTILLSALIAQARSVTMDEGEVPRHSNDDYLALANAGQRQMAIYKPDVAVTNAARQLASGTKQSVASAATAFIKLTRNMGTDGQTPGRTILYEDMERFSRHNPHWHMADAGAEVRFYLFDVKDPKVFYVYPPQPAANQGWVEEVDAVAPTDITSAGHAIGVDDIYSNALVDYMLFRIFEIESSINPYAAAKELAHWNLFVTALGRLDLLKVQSSPKEPQEQNNAG